MDILYDSFIIYGTLVSTYFISSYCNYLLDTNHIFEKYKIKKRSDVEYKELYKKCLPNVLKNVCLYTIPYSYGILYLQDKIYPNNKNIYIDNGYGFGNGYDNILYFLNVIMKGILSYIIFDIVFYIGHRLMHTKKLYMYHKIHHEIKNPISIAALYMHPIDLYLSNLSPTLISILLLNPDLLMKQLLIVAQILFTTIGAHGGYDKISLTHNIHHTLFKYNYGVGGYKYCLDKLNNTEYIEDIDNSVDNSVDEIVRSKIKEE